MFKLLAGVAGVCVVGFAGGAGYALSRPMSSVVETQAYTVPTATVSDLESIANMRVFFGHQSVGGNMMAALPNVYAAAGVEPPNVVKADEMPAGPGPVFVHTNIGRNGDPLGKVAAFDSALRNGVGESVDVAILKFCYVDVQQGTDVDEIFAEYRDTMAALERDYPNVTFIYATVPVTKELGASERAKTRVKSLLGDSSTLTPEHNVAREELNALIRAEYAGTGRLFDIAAIQSTTADGVRRVRRHDGQDFFAMEPFLASDPGHLNPYGAAIVASAFFATVAEATA